VQADLCLQKNAAERDTQLVCREYETSLADKGVVDFFFTQPEYVHSVAVNTFSCGQGTTATTTTATTTTATTTTTTTTTATTKTATTTTLSGQRPVQTK
jgi:site-specific DNA-adenine methylase